MSEPEQDFDNPKAVYRGERIPFFIKLAWVTLIIWVLAYLAIYALPNFKQWV